MKSGQFSLFSRRSLASLLVAAALTAVVPGVTVVAQEEVMYSPNFKGTDINEFINIVGMNLKKPLLLIRRCVAVLMCAATKC